MKVILLFSLLFVLGNVYSQNNNTTQTTSIEVSGPKSGIELANSAAKEQGFYSLGNGVVKVVKVGGSGFVKLSTLKNRAEEQIMIYAKNNNLTYKVLNVEEQKQSIGVFPKVSITYQLIDSTGNPFLSKEDKDRNREDVIKELKQLKELLDLGIITKDEFEAKSSKLKKFLLDNK